MLPNIHTQTAIATQQLLYKDKQSIVNNPAICEYETFIFFVISSDSAQQNFTHYTAKFYTSHSKILDSAILEVIRKGKIRFHLWMKSAPFSPPITFTGNAQENARPRVSLFSVKIKTCRSNFDGQKNSSRTGTKF